MLTANGSPCVHEIPVIFERVPRLEEIFEAGYHGIADPSFLPLYGDAVNEFRGRPTAVILRDSEQSRRSFEKFLGNPVHRWCVFENALASFRQHFAPMTVRFEDLDSYDVCNRLVEHLTGRPLDRRVFDLFNVLQIEQHREKARAAVEALV